MTKWEYKRHGLVDNYSELVPWLNEQGAQGWELLFCQEEFIGKEGSSDLRWEFRCIFKRPIPETPQGLLVLDERKAVRVCSETGQWYYEDDDADRWHDTWQKVDEYMRDQ